MKFLHLIILHLCLPTLSSADFIHPSVDLFCWSPALALSSSGLAQIRSNVISNDNITINNFMLPDDCKEGIHGFLRIGLFLPGIDQWIGCLIHLLALDGKSHSVIMLHTDPLTTEIYHISLQSVDSKSISVTQNQERLGYQLSLSELGPRPHLSAKVKLTSDGTIPEPAPEKTFLQK